MHDKKGKLNQHLHAGVILLEYYQLIDATQLKLQTMQR